MPDIVYYALKRCVCRFVTEQLCRPLYSTFKRLLFELIMDIYARRRWYWSRIIWHLNVCKFVKRPEIQPHNSHRLKCRMLHPTSWASNSPRPYFDERPNYRVYLMTLHHVGACEDALIRIPVYQINIWHQTTCSPSRMSIFRYRITNSDATNIL